MLRTTSLIGFGSGTSGGLGPLTDITASMWGGLTSKYTLTNNDVAKTGSASSLFYNIRIINSAPVLDGDFVWQYTQIGNMGGNTSSSYGMYDITEDSTFSSTAFEQGLNSMTNSYWFMSGTGTTIKTQEADTELTTGISFSVNDQFKWQRTGTTLTLSIAGSVVQTWTGTSESLRFCMSGFHTPANINDIDNVQFQN